MAKVFTKDPDAVLDYKFDWSSWLATGETITSRTVTVDAGLTNDSDSITDSGASVTVWLSGGTANKNYAVACKITTDGGRTDERTDTIHVRQR